MTASRGIALSVVLFGWAMPPVAAQTQPAPAPAAAPTLPGEIAEPVVSPAVPATSEAAPEPVPPAPVAAAPAPPPPPAAPPKQAAPPAAGEAPPDTVLLHQPATVLGTDVRSSDNKATGRVVDVLIDPNGQPRAAVIDFGGFLGVGTRRLAVDWSRVHFVAGSKTPATVDLTTDQLQAAPEYKDVKGAVTVVAPTPSGAPAAAPAPAGAATISVPPTVAPDQAPPVAPAPPQQTPAPVPEPAPSGPTP